MAKWSGVIGYAVTEETSPGIYEEKIIEHKYTGNVLQNTRRLQSSGQVNDDIEVTNRISIVSNPFARKNFHSMRYISFMGTMWKVSSVDVKYPRLILSIGGVYNGQQTTSA